MINSMSGTKRLITSLTVIGLINVVVYLLMYLNGVDPVHPSLDDLMKYGANYAPKTASGGWWRLFTSMFLHSGFLHLFCNMAALYQASVMFDFAEEDEILAVYFLSGITGGIFSMMAHPYAPGVGASGAIMGLYGAIVMYRIMRRKLDHLVLKKQQLIIALTTLVGAVVPSGAESKVDIACHLGGAVTGLVLGYLLSYQRDRSKFEYGMLGIGVMSLLAFIALPKRPDMLKVMKELAANVEQFKAVDEEIRTRQKNLSSAMSALEFENFILLNVNPRIKTMRDKMASVGTLHDSKTEAKVSKIRADIEKMAARVLFLSQVVGLIRQDYELMDAIKDNQMTYAQATDRIVTQFLPAFSRAEKTFLASFPDGAADDFYKRLASLRSAMIGEAVAMEVNSIKKIMIGEFTQYINLVKSPAQTEASTLQGLQYLDSKVKDYLARQAARNATFPKAMLADGKLAKVMEANHDTFALMRTYALESLMRFRFATLAMQLNSKKINAAGGVNYMRSHLHPILEQYFDTKTPGSAPAMQHVRKLASARSEALRHLNVGLMTSDRNKIAQSAYLWKVIDQSPAETQIWAVFSKLATTLQAYTASTNFGF